ncbi:MAG: glycosyltransferase family 39 protein [Cyanobacteria bacterium J06627_8]
MARDLSSYSQSPLRSSADVKRGLWLYGALLAVVVVGTGLRFWNLDSKALWLDEVIGAIFSFGRNLNDVPLDQFFDLSALGGLFQLNADATCASILHSVSTDSVHPPLYFCLAYQWLSLWQPNGEQWIWVLRSLPAVLGVACLPVIYGLNQKLSTPTAGIAGALLMAVSPFAVYLSQEARHYTLPMLLTLLTLWILAHIQHHMMIDRPIPWSWLLGWSVLSSIGLYVHYFYLLVVVGQAIAIITVLAWSTGHPPLSSHSDLSHLDLATSSHPTQQTSIQRGPTLRKRIRQHGTRFVLAVMLLVISYLPWIPTLLNHISRPETDWLKPYNPDWSDRIAPIYQTVSNLLLMVVAFPVEGQPWTIGGLSALLMMMIGGWIGWQTAVGLTQQWNMSPAQRPGLLLLLAFVGCVLLEFFAITYVLDKDVTSVPRYAFVYYPGVAALIGIGLSQRWNTCFDSKSRLFKESLADQNTNTSRSQQASNPWRWVRQTLVRQPLAIALLAGVISSVFVVNGWVFQKGYYPRTVARDLTAEGDRPVMLAVSYQSLQEVGLGLSFALEMQKRYESEPDPQARVAFIHRPRGYRQVWRSLADLNHDLPLPLNLWVVASPGMKTKDYPETLKLRVSNRRRRTDCRVDPDQFYRIGFPYQLFRCEKPQRQVRP